MKHTRLLIPFLLSMFLLLCLAGCKEESEPTLPVMTTQQIVTTEEPTTPVPTTPVPTTEEPTTEAPTTAEPTTEEPTAEVADEFGVGAKWYVNTDTLNVRSGPSADSEKLASLYRGEQVLILAISGDWVKIMSATADGYVNSAFLCATYAETGLTGEPPKDVDEGMNIVNANAAATSAAVAATTAAPSGNGHIVCIDAGHQQAGISEQEPNGPGSTVMKAKLTTGTQGCVTGLAEHQLNLTIALALKQELLNRGYKVVMIRETADCPKSNAERAQIANNSGAEIFIRIHANSSTNSSIAGAQFYAPSPANPYLSSSVVTASNTLSAVMLDRFCAATGAQNRGVLQDDGMSGINWCTIPVTIAEMGFMSNPAEDQLMSDPSYQAKMVQGLANGIDAYFGR